MKSMQWFVCRQARVSHRKEPIWHGSKATPTKNRKLLGFGPLFFVKPSILFSFFCNYFTLFQYSRQERGRGVPPPWLRASSWAYQFREKSLRNDTGAKYTILAMDPIKCSPALRFILYMAARRPPEKSELFSLLGAPQVSQRSVGCSAPSSLLDPILDCSVLSWLFDVSLSIGAARHPPCCSDLHSLDQLRASWLFIFLCVCVPTTLPADRGPKVDSASAHSHGRLEPSEGCCRC